MIRKRDILDRAAECQLHPEVVEKDYILAWLLASLASIPAGASWIFKGGTSINKNPGSGCSALVTDLPGCVAPDKIIGAALRRIQGAMDPYLQNMKGMMTRSCPGGRINVESMHE